MNDELENFRNNASKQSLGLSSNDIVTTIIEYIKNDNSTSPKNILDIGCGTGNLLNLLAKEFPNAILHGCDYSEFSDWKEEKNINFFKHDCNLDLPSSLGCFDLIVSSEVIEHIENGRHFVRELTKHLNPNGKLIISTPNIESITSLLSFFFRGYHSAFGEKDYPAHILPIAAYDLNNMLKETQLFSSIITNYIQNGRVPKTELKWRDFFPFLTGKRFSDNYFITATKRK